MRQVYIKMRLARQESILSFVWSGEITRTPDDSIGQQPGDMNRGGQQDQAFGVNEETFEMRSVGAVYSGAAGDNECGFGWRAAGGFCVSR